MSKIIVSGSVAFDRIMYFPGTFSEHVIPDKMPSINISFKVDRLSVEFGGTAGNVAYSLAQLGEQPEIIATVGSDFSQYRSHLLLSGVDPRTVREVEGELTASAFVLTDKAENQIAAFHPGASDHVYDTPVDTDGRALAIVCAGCEADMIALPKYYRERGMRYLYDPGQQIPALTADALKAGITGAQVLFANDYEMAMIQQKTGITELGFLELVQTVVITYAEKGSRVLRRDGEWRVASVPPKQLLDPTGAGDGYRAGFIKGMLLGFPLPVCAKLGSVVAAYAIETFGTQTHKFTMDDLAARYRAAYGEKITIA